MKAAVYYETGAPSVFKYEDVPDPECHPQGVTIRVEAVSIEGGDVLNRAGGIMASTPHCVGYQAAGTRGRSLQDGAKEIRIHGKQIRVRASIETVDGLSAHADRSGLIDWLDGAPRPPGRVHLVHGEPSATEALEGLIHERLGLNVHRPSYLEKVEI